ncbi:MAG: PD-(D/E)XK nuclease family protein [Candidatus Pacebacteria bacterium]|nr:PD-(D/E)XK nuclease family protein [Candidatus Paceibacterota bacterium]
MPIKISRSKIDLFLECPKCFYLDKVLGVPRPPGFPFTLNSAVDNLLKKEFDIHRAKGEPHPLMKTYGIDAVPFKHEKIEEWRDARTRGIRFLHEPTDILVGGGIDDMWVNSKGELHVVDYKATAKAGRVNLDAEWQIGYKRQVEVYQWLFRKNGFKVSDVAYFVYVNGKRDAAAFDARLEFDIDIIPYKGNDDWIEKVLFEIRKTLDGDDVPKESKNCEYCAYRNAVNEAEM